MRTRGKENKCNSRKETRNSVKVAVELWDKLTVSLKKYFLSHYSLSPTTYHSLSHPLSININLI